MGYSVKTYAKTPGRPNLISVLHGFESKPNLLFIRHADNISASRAEVWQHPPYSGELSKGRIYGRGVADMKSGLAAMIFAGRAIKESGIRIKGGYSVASVADEEVESQYGMKYLARGFSRGMSPLLVADAAVFGEPSFPWIVVALKGGVWLRITVKGKSIGSGWTHKGVNAVTRMAKVLLELEKLDLGRLDHPLLGRPTIAAGTTIRGGVGLYSISDRCEATVEVYTVPGLGTPEVLSKVERLLEKMKRKDKDLSVKVEPIFEVDSYLTDSNERVYTCAQSAIMSVMGKHAKRIGVPSVGDARFLRQLGIPCVVAYGPGEYGREHVIDESVRVESLIRVTKIYALTALRFWSATG